MTMKMPFGKHKGEDLSAIPESYLRWILTNIENLNPMLRRAIEARLAEGPSDVPPPRGPRPADAFESVRSLFKATHRGLAIRFHPDRGGTTEAMVALNEMRDKFLAALDYEESRSR